MSLSRNISWITPARKDFEAFPKQVQDDMKNALVIAAAGGKSDIAKPFHGVDGGVFEIVVAYRKDAFRTNYAVKIDKDVWVIHAFKKKSKTGIKTPQPDVDLIHNRLTRLKAKLKEA